MGVTVLSNITLEVIPHHLFHILLISSKSCSGLRGGFTKVHEYHSPKTKMTSVLESAHHEGPRMSSAALHQCLGVEHYMVPSIRGKFWCRLGELAAVGSPSTFIWVIKAQ